METDGKPTLTIGIIQLLKNLDLKADFDKALISMLNSKNLGRGDEALAFGHQKLDELAEFVRINQTTDGTTTADLKLLILGWLNEHLVGGHNDR